MTIFLMSSYTFSVVTENRKLFCNQGADLGEKWYDLAGINISSQYKNLSQCLNLASKMNLCVIIRAIPV
jgi:hypothetical protein